jgi:hypothetical protein
VSEQHGVGFMVCSCSAQCRIASAPRRGLETAAAADNNRANLSGKTKLPTRVGCALCDFGGIILHLMIDDDRSDVGTVVIAKPGSCSSERQ